MFIIPSTIKKLRKILKLNQLDFANRINISRSNLANIENGNVMLTKRVKNNILKEFNVNEHWFDYGKGTVFNDITDNIINELATQKSLDEIDKQTIKLFLKLNNNQRKQVLGYIHKLKEEL